MRQQLLHKLLRRSRGKSLVEFDDKQMAYSEVANQFDLVLRGRKQMGCVAGPKHFHRMRIENNDPGSALGRSGVFGRGGNDGLMTAVHTIEGPDGEKDRARQAREFVERAKCF